MIDTMPCMTRIDTDQIPADLTITMNDEKTGARLGHRGRTWVLAMPDAAWTAPCDHCPEVAYHMVTAPDEEEGES